MIKIPLSAKISLWATRFIALVLLVLIFTMPRLLEWYSEIRTMDFPADMTVLVAFYICCLPTAHALWKLDRMLRGIVRGEVFSRMTARCIKAIRWDCLAVCVICLPAAVFYPPLGFMVVIMAFLSLIVSVLSAVMDAAVQIREENDLTI